MDWDVVRALAVSIGALVTAAAFVWSFRIHRDQTVLARELNRQQRLLAQRQLLLPLWDYLRNIRSVHPTDPDEEDLIETVNTLELVALCLEGELVDKTLILRTFGEKYLELCGQIKDARPKKGKWKSGRALLEDNPAASNLCKELSAARQKQNVSSPIERSQITTPSVGESEKFK